MTNFCTFFSNSSYLSVDELLMLPLTFSWNNRSLSLRNLYANDSLYFKSFLSRLSLLSSPLPSVACPDNFILKDMKLQEKFQLQYNKKAAYLLNKVLNNNSTKINNNNERGPSHIFGKLYSVTSDNTSESQYKKFGLVWFGLFGAVLRVCPCVTYESKSVSYHLIAKNQTQNLTWIHILQNLEFHLMTLQGDGIHGK